MQYLEFESGMQYDLNQAREDLRRRASLASRDSPVPAGHSPQDSCEMVNQRLPDGMMVLADQTVEQVWTFHNAGKVTWNGRYLTRQGAAWGDIGLDTPAKIAIPTTEPGQSVPVTVPIRASHWVGSYIIYFKITDGRGRPYFPTQMPAYWSVEVIDSPHQDRPELVSPRGVGTDS